ncbi:hypothetical protein [Phenylobacterium montanum]|uniref:Uncharacterized protein n=1 Tax=Phenylobacterium montanum TaxID=2823693 RepID=A0A975G3F7_9CAUL|nr:hypothetical protein [Caulobacter sp. S6]QUD89858.1 hypothetical protein KCG34_08305 [Caulobacter sp. S6]
MYELPQPFHLSALPIVRRYRPISAIFLQVALFVILVAVTGPFVWFSYKQEHSFLNLYSIGAVAVDAIPISLIFYFVSLGGSTLTIDNTGVHQKLGRSQQDFLWTEISGTQIIEKSEGGGRGPAWKSKQVQLQTFNRRDYDNRTNLISGIFGITASDLDTVIQAGLDRWGGAQSKPASAGPTPTALTS